MSIETIPIIKRWNGSRSDGHVYNVRAQDSLSNRRNTTAYGIRSKSTVPTLLRTNGSDMAYSRQEKQPDKETFFFDRHSAQPGRDDRNKQVNADQGIHKP